MRQPRKHRIHQAFEPHPSLHYRPPPFLRRVRLGLAVTVGLVSVSIIYVLLWVGMAFQFRDSLNGWAEARRAEGYQINYTSYLLSGFPLAFRLELREPSFAAPAAAAWSWSGDLAVAEAYPWNPWQVAIRIEGKQSLSIPRGNGNVTYAGAAQEFTAEFPVPGNWPPEGRLTVSGLDLSGGPSGRIAARRVVVDVQSPNGEGSDHRTPTIALKIEAEGVTAPAALSLPLGDTIGGFTFEGSVLGYIEQGPWPDALEAWRDAGGALEARRLKAAYGPLNVEGGGTIALDAAAQPIGAFTAKAQGFFETVEILRREGMISGKDAITATLVLGALAHKSKDGGASTLNLAFTLQDLKLYAGPVALADLPPIPWPEP